MVIGTDEEIVQNLTKALLLYLDNKFPFNCIILEPDRYPG
jgi:hypothetical protein